MNSIFRSRFDHVLMNTIFLLFSFFLFFFFFFFFRGLKYFVLSAMRRVCSTCFNNFAMKMGVPYSKMNSVSIGKKKKKIVYAIAIILIEETETK